MYESCTEDDSDDGSLSKNDIKEIRYGNNVHPDINAIYARLKISEHIKQAQNGWKGSELSVKRMHKGLNKFFKDV